MISEVLCYRPSQPPLAGQTLGAPPGMRAGWTPRYALSLGRSEGMTKLIIDPEDGRVIGAGIVGPGAGDLIAEVALAIEMGCDAEDIGLTIHAHPTLSETVAMAAEMWTGSITDLYVPKKR